MSYLKSNLVKVFPSAYREEVSDKTSSLTTEGQLTSLAVAGLDRQSFVKEDSESNLVIYFQGYKFVVKKSDVTNLFTSGETTIYVKAKIHGRNTPVVPEELSYSPTLTGSDVEGSDFNPDIDGEFRALDFVSTETDGYMKILEKKNNVWNIVENAKIVLNTESITNKDKYTENSINNIFVTSRLESGKHSGEYGALGLYSHAEGIGSKATGNGAHAEGQNTTASGYCSHAEGIGTKALGNYSHAEGLSTSSTGLHSHSEGNYTTASNEYSHAEGVSTVASGKASHAEGHGTKATGDYSHAEGDNAKATSEYSHAEGVNTKTVGVASHAEGYNTTASGDFSHSEGRDTESSGWYSHTEGWGTKATGIYSKALGTWNEPNYQESGVVHNYLLSIGNGTSNNNRSNIVSVTSENVSVDGGLKVNNSDVITKEFIKKEVFATGASLENITSFIGNHEYVIRMTHQISSSGTQNLLQSGTKLFYINNSGSVTAVSSTLGSNESISIYYLDI